MEVRYRCNPDDYVEAQKTYAKRSRASSLLAVMAAVLALIALYMVIFVDIYRALPLALVAALWMVPRFIFPWRMRRDFERHPNLTREHLLRVDEEGIFLASEIGQGSTKWSGYTAFLEAPNVFLLFTGARVFHIIPKRAFAPVDLNEFRGLLQRHVRPR